MKTIQSVPPRRIPARRLRALAAAVSLCALFCSAPAYSLDVVTTDKEVIDQYERDQGRFRKIVAEWANARTEPERIAALGRLNKMCKYCEISRGRNNRVEIVWNNTDAAGIMSVPEAVAQKLRRIFSLP